MDKNSYTNEEQAAKLKALGVPESTCDLWKTSQVGGYRISTEKEVNSKPVWSLGRLMRFLKGTFFDDLNQRNLFYIEVDLSDFGLNAMVGLAAHYTVNTGNSIDNCIGMIEYINKVCSEKIDYETTLF